MVHDAGEEARSLSEEGVPARVDDDSLALAALHGRAHLELVTGVDGRGERLARERRLVNLQRHARQEQRIRRDDVPEFDFDQVPGHELARAHIRPVPIAAHVRVRLERILEGRNRVASIRLLNVSDERIRKLEDDQDRKVEPSVTRERRFDEFDERGHPNHDRHRALRDVGGGGGCRGGGAWGRRVRGTTLAARPPTRLCVFAACTHPKVAQKEKDGVDLLLRQLVRAPRIEALLRDG